MGITIDKVRDLSGSTDNVNLSDGTDSLDINADGSINVVISGQSNVYAEDTAHVSGDDGNFVLAVRQDTKASTGSADGDYVAMIQNASGELYVTDEDSEALLTTIDADTSLISAATQLEDSASAGGERLMIVGGYRQDAATSPVSADGDFHSFIFNDSGQLKVEAQLDNVCNTSIVVTTVSVDTTVGGTQLVASALSGRREITIQNLGAQDVWIKNATGVTAGAGGNGFLLPKDSSATYMWGPALDPYAITASGTSSLKVIECS